MRSWLVACTVVLGGLIGGAQSVPTPVEDPTPTTLDAFRTAAAAVLDETGVPGAGIALVNVNGTEWAGGVGWADRDRRVPVTAETHFRAGSISKSFVALALVQLYEDGKLDLDARLSDLVPEVAIENPWAEAAPVTVRQLLEHTAGFDDMHFNEMYVLDDGPDLPLTDVLMRNPASRRVRWRPGTRMSYANPGYAVAGLVVEKVSGTPYDEFIEQRIFTPLEMPTSSFRLAPEADSALAQGYAAAAGPPVTRRRIYLRPAGALHTSAGELAHFVQALLGWGERGAGYVVDPEYLSNMEWPRTTLASRAGVRAGYGLGIGSTITFPYHVLGHNGGIDGFLSTYGYSPTRDVGYVVLINSTHAPEALTRLSSLAIRYLKRDVEPPAKPSRVVAPEVLRRYEGYYRDLSPRNGLLQALQYVRAGHSVRLDGDHLVLARDFGGAEPLVAVEDTLFRRARESDASLAFTEDEDGRPVLTGPGLYAERADRWPVMTLRGALAVAVAIALLAPLVALGRWLQLRRRGERPTTFAGLGIVWWAAALTLGAAICALAGAPATELSTTSLRALVVYGSSLAYPVLAFLAVAGCAWGLFGRPGAAYATLATLAAAAHVGLATFLAAWGLIGLRTWTY